MTSDSIVHLEDRQLPNIWEVLSTIMKIYDVWGHMWRNDKLHVFAGMKEWVYPYSVPVDHNDWETWSKGLQDFINKMIDSHNAFLATDEGIEWKAGHEERMNKMRMEREQLDKLRLEREQLERERLERKRLEQTQHTEEVSATDDDGYYY